ncbi:phage/plasmid replication protein, partial [Acinetobacter baumannii]|uniref:phage/plasmid replication domain-containing protein n=1 Tax=Acinetobacter baumannii TaxID=470 RepID=UPI00224264D5
FFLMFFSYIFLCYSTPTGRLSKVKTRNLTSFLCVLVMIGIEKIKKDHDEKTFKKYMNELKKCGITEKYITELSEEMRNFII